MADKKRTAWCVSSGSYSDYRVLCVCDSKKRANHVVSLLRGQPSGWHNDASVAEIPFVDYEPEISTLLRISQEFFDDGAENEVRESSDSDYAFVSLYEHVPVSWRWVRAPIYKNKGGRLDVEGTDHELVRKVFGEKRAQIKADPALKMRKEAKGKGR